MQKEHAGHSRTRVKYKQNSVTLRTRNTTSNCCGPISSVSWQPLCPSLLATHSTCSPVVPSSLCHNLVIDEVSLLSDPTPLVLDLSLILVGLHLSSSVPVLKRRVSVPIGSFIQLHASCHPLLVTQAIPLELVCWKGRSSDDGIQ